MITILLILVLLTITVEAITEILTSSTLINPLQTRWRIWVYPLDGPPPNNILHNLGVFIDRLWNCGYCASVWVAGFFAIFAPIIFQDKLVNWVIMTFTLHRLANWLHVVYELVRRGRVNSLDIMLKITENEDGTIRQSPGEAATEIESEHFEPS